MDGIAAFPHVEASGFDAGCGIRPGKITMGNAVLLKKGGEGLVGQGAALCLCKHVVGYHLQLRHQLRAMSAGLERSGSRRQVVMLNINDPQSPLGCPVNCLIDFSYDLLVILRNVILQVDYDQCAVFHIFPLKII